MLWNGLCWRNGVGVKKYFLYFLATLLAVCSCGSAQGESEFVRQVALPDVDGFVVSEGPLASPVDALLKRDQLHFQSDRGSPELSREFVAVLEWFEESLGRFPVLLTCLLYTSPSPRDRQKSRMPSSA